MKHPALARVFAVVLAVLGLILLAVGISALRKNEEEHADRLAYAKKYTGRIENYQKLHEELENAADYKETMAALDSFLTAHEKAASQHKTDTATYSAAKGGIKMGEDMILAARAEMNDMRTQIKDASTRKSYLEGMISQLLATQKDKLPWLDALAGTAAEYAIDSYRESAELLVASSKIRAMRDAEPLPDDFAGPPQAPAMPAFPQLPNMDSASYEAMQAAWQGAMAQMQSAAADYSQANAQYAQDMQKYYDQQAQAVIERAYRMQDAALGRAAEEVYTAEYRRENAAWDASCRQLRAEVKLLRYSDEIHRLSTALSGIVRKANALTFFLEPETGGMFPGMQELAILAELTADRIRRQGADPASLSNEEFLRLADEGEEILGELGDAFTVVSARIYDPSDLILELMDKLHVTDLLIQYLDYMLDKTEQQLQGALEELWYQLGEQEKEQIRLEAEKLDLDEEAVILSKDVLEADALKDLRNRHNSARQLLLSVPEVKSATEESGDMVASARDYLDTYESRTGQLYSGRRLIGLLAVAGGVMGILGIPAAYELIKKRFCLLAPALLCLVCAAAAEGLSLFLGLGQMYPALFTAIFALLHLLIVLPKKKRAVYAPMH